VELPLNIRNVFGLVALDSSVNNSQQNQALNRRAHRATSIRQSPSSISAAGASTTAFLGTATGKARGLGRNHLCPSVDELQEFKISDNTFLAPVRWSMGNVVNAITKSGTRSFHGTMFEFLRNNNLDAK